MDAESLRIRVDDYLSRLPLAPEEGERLRIRADALLRRHPTPDAAAVFSELHEALGGESEQSDTPSLGSLEARLQRLGADHPRRGASAGW